MATGKHGAIIAELEQLRQRFSDSALDECSLRLSRSEQGKLYAYASLPEYTPTSPALAAFEQAVSWAAQLIPALRKAGVVSGDPNSSSWDAPREWHHLLWGRFLNSIHSYMSAGGDRVYLIENASKWSVLAIDDMLRAIRVAPTRNKPALTGKKRNRNESRDKATAIVVAILQNHHRSGRDDEEQVYATLLLEDIREKAAKSNLSSSTVSRVMKQLFRDFHGKKGFAAYKAVFATSPEKGIAILERDGSNSYDVAMQ